jgi:hypothetical protein
VVKSVHDKGMKVRGHLCSVTYREAADMGIDNLEHGFMVALLSVSINLHYIFD